MAARLNSGDLDGHLKTLSDAGLLHVVDKPIDKDREMHPLVRWQYRGGVPEAQRKAFLFTNVTDAKGRSYPGARVAIGALAGTAHIYALGLGKPEAKGVVRYDAKTGKVEYPANFPLRDDFGTDE